MVYLDMPAKHPFMDYGRDKTRRWIIRHELKMYIFPEVRNRVKQRQKTGNFEPIDVQIPYWLPNSVMSISFYDKLDDDSKAHAVASDISYFNELFSTFKARFLAKYKQWEVLIQLASSPSGEDGAPVNIRAQHK